jgi:hypothetical protein
MAKQMKPAAKIYLQESAVLEEARNELAHELNDLWAMIWKDAEPQLTELAQSHNRIVHLWENKTEEGNYHITSLPSGAVGTTKGNLNKDDKAGKKLRISIHDPRTSETPGSYNIALRLAQVVQPGIKKQWPAVPDKIKELITSQGLKGPVKWGSGTLWSTTISVDPDDLEKTTSEISSTVYGLFSVITEFEKRQAKARGGR